jgi:hypothetical protein
MISVTLKRSHWAKEEAKEYTRNRNDLVQLSCTEFNIVWQFCRKLFFYRLQVDILYVN